MNVNRSLSHHLPISMKILSGNVAFPIYYSVSETSIIKLIKNNFLIILPSNFSIQPEFFSSSSQYFIQMGKSLFSKMELPILMKFTTHTQTQKKCWELFQKELRFLSWLIFCFNRKLNMYCFLCLCYIYFQELRNFVELLKSLFENAWGGLKRI